MRVLHLLGKSYGGIRQHVSELDKELKKRSIDSVLAGPEGVMLGLAVQEYIIPTQNDRNPSSIIKSVRILRKVVKDFDVLHAHGTTAGYLLWFSQISGTKKPIVLTTHNVAHRGVLGVWYWLVKFFQSLLLWRVERIICPSQFALDQLSLSNNAYKKASVILPVSKSVSSNQIQEARNKRAQTRETFGINEDEILLVSLARISKDKDLSTLIEAFHLATKSEEKIKLLIAGRGEKKEIKNITDLIARKNLIGKVLLIGFFEAPDELLCASDLVVLTSLCETAPLVLLEAMSLGLPFLSTDVGIAPNVLDGVIGQCSKAGDSIAFSEMIESWSNKVRSNTIDSRAIEAVFSSLVDKEKNIQPIVDIYFECVKEK